MNTDSNKTPSALTWNKGGWFGTQVGGTLWLLILGLVLLTKDGLAGWVCVGSFLVLNALGCYLWQSRTRVSAYAALQWFLLAASVIIAVAVVVVNSRGLAGPPAAGALVSTYLPYWVIVVAPALMLFFYFLQRSFTRGNN